MEPTRTITASEYTYLRDRAEFLECLEACGVVNWQGYEDAQEMYAEAEEE